MDKDRIDETAKAIMVAIAALETKADDWGHHDTAWHAYECAKALEHERLKREEDDNQ